MPANVETMMFVGETPWHGLGTKLDKVATSEEAIIAAGLDWTVSLNPVYTKNEVNPAMATIPEFVAVTRDTDGQVFNIMKKRFVPTQNRQAFQFFDELVGEKKAIYHTAGSLQGGKVIWILAKLPEDLIIKGEEINKFLLLVNAHDGSRAREMFHTGIRVVCSNTLAMADNGAKSKFYARHTVNSLSSAKVAEAREALGIADRFYAQFEEEADRLANLQLTAEARPKLLKMAFTGNPETKDDEIWHPIKVAMDKAEELITVGKGNNNPKIQGTRYQAYNGIVEYVDYFRGNKKTIDQRLSSAWFGSGNEVKQRAWDYLLKI